MNDLVFFNDSVIGREIAFVLGITFNFIDEIKKENLSDNRLFIQNSQEEEIAISEGLVRGKDYISFDELYDFLDQFNRDWETSDRQDYPITHELSEIDKMYSGMLYLSEMLVKVLFSKSKDIECKELTTKYNIDSFGNLWGCCPGWITKSFGNYLYEESVDDNYYARIIKLSQLNKTFCFCNLTQCRYYGKQEINQPSIKFDVPKYPKQLTVSIDRTCNLRCNSCRKEFYNPSETEKKLTSDIAQRLIESDILNHTEVVIAGQGEVFYSENYDKILKSIQKTDIIKIFSNGTLFTKEKWDIIYPKFKEIHVSISIDACHKDTYRKLRHGDFNSLIKNLDFIRKLKEENKISQLWFNFVVQRDNMYEMKEFVIFSEKHHVDKLQFTKLNNWGTMSDKEYLNKCLIIDDYLDYELYTILQDPLFQKPFVDIEFFHEYMLHSKEHYE